MSRDRLLVTGVGGFVGGHLARAATSRGHEVHGLGVQPSSQATRALLASERLVNVEDPSGLVQAIAAVRPAAVVHLAGQSSVAASIERPVETFGANALGTWNLLEAVRAEAPTARVLVVGSADSYGPQAEGTQVSEQAPLRPVSPYGLSKAVADSTAAFYAETFALDVVRTRSFAHVGPGQSERFMIPSVARQIAEAERGGRGTALRLGNLEITRDLTDVRDVVDAYLALLDRARSGAVYNVCRGEGTRLADLARTLSERARVPVRVEVDPARLRPADIEYLVGDPTKIRTEIGWMPAIPLEQTLEEILVEWRGR